MKPLTQKNRVIRLGAITFGVLIVSAVVVSQLVDVNAFRLKRESDLSAALGGHNPFVTATSFKAGVGIMPLIFSKTLHISEQPRLRCRWQSTS